MSTICIYHKGCLDGFGAAWVVRKAFLARNDSDITFYPASYQEAPPEVSGKHVIIVDFSYKRPVMDEITTDAKSVLILDHHESAEQELEGIFEYQKVGGKFDLDQSGVRLAWEWFFPNNTAPPALLLIEDRDLWRFKLPNTKEVCATLYSHPQDFDVWDRLLEPDCLLKLIADGEALLRQQGRSVQSLINSCAKEISFQGHKILAANIPYMFASDAGNEMSKGRPFSLTFYYDKNDCPHYSLRSDSNGINVSKIAVKYGGGGHKHAAGFKLEPGLLLEIDGDV